MRGLVLLTDAAVDVLFFLQEALEFGVGLAEERLGRRLVIGALGGLGNRRRLAGRTFLGLAPPATAGADNAPPGRLARSLADGHGRLPRDLCLVRALVRQDLALVDPHLHADATERRARFRESVVDVGTERVERDA